MLRRFLHSKDSILRTRSIQSTSKHSHSTPLWKHCLQKYGKLVSKSPYKTQMIMAGGMTAVGDTIAQVVFEKQTKFDFARTIKFSLAGAFYAAPALVFWLRTLDKRLGAKFTFKKLFADQLIGNPIVTGGFMLVNGGMNGLSFVQSFEMMKRDFPGMMLNAWPFWGGIALFNLKFVPLNYRLLVIKIASLAWNTFLALQVKLAYDRAKMVDASVNVNDENESNITNQDTQKLEPDKIENSNI